MYNNDVFMYNSIDIWAKIELSSWFIWLLIFLDRLNEDGKYKYKIKQIKKMIVKIINRVLINELLN